MRQFLFVWWIVCLGIMQISAQNFIKESDEEDVAIITDEVFSLKQEKYSFSRSKRLLATKVYKGHQRAFYSDCKYRIWQRRLKPLHQSCGFKYRKNEKRSKRIEWEHIVPAWYFGHALACWKNGGRKRCRQLNTQFKQMEADMHNLVPAIGEINGDRSNFKYSPIYQKQSFYGDVDMKILFNKKYAQPPKSKYGEIARTYFYMRDRYGLKISAEQEQLFITWNNNDPVDSWEKIRNRRIEKLQGDENLYVSDYKKITSLNPLPNSKQEEEKQEHKPIKNIEDLINQLPKPLAILVLIVIALYRFFVLKKKS